MTKILGVVLVVVGLVLAIATVMQLDRGDDMVGTTATARTDAESAGTLAVVALPLVAGLSFASGIVLLLVGVGRWSNPGRAPNPATPWWIPRPTTRWITSRAAAMERCAW